MIYRLLTIVFLLLPISGFLHWLLPDFRYVEVKHESELKVTPATILNRHIFNEIERDFEYRLGNFRKGLAIAHNEFKFNFFPSRPNPNYIWTNERGFYPVDTLKRQNSEVQRNINAERVFWLSARRLKLLQDILASRGVFLSVVLAPPKVKIYPEAVRRYLSQPDPSNSVYVSYAKFLKKQKVNNIDAALVLNQMREGSTPPLYAMAGFHWNFFSGCHITNTLLEQYMDFKSQIVPTHECQDYKLEPASGLDTDIINPLNVLSGASRRGYSPSLNYQKKYNEYANFPAITIVGDSFADQLVVSLLKLLPTQSWQPYIIENFNYLTQRHRVAMNGHVIRSAGLAPDQFLQHVLTRDWLLLEVYDANISRDDIREQEHGATNQLFASFFDQSPFTANGRALLFVGNIGSNQEGSGFKLNSGKNVILIQKKLPSKIPFCLTGNSENEKVAFETRVLIDGAPLNPKLLLGDMECFEVPASLKSIDPDFLVLEIKSDRPIDSAQVISFEGLEFANRQTDFKKTQKDESTNEYNLLENQKIKENLKFSGLLGLERDNLRPFRWAAGPSSIIEFYHKPKPGAKGLLTIELMNGVPIPEQELNIILNGEQLDVGSSISLPSGERVNYKLWLDLAAGYNKIEFNFNDWNHGKEKYSNDPRHLSAVFTELKIKML